MLQVGLDVGAIPRLVANYLPEVTELRHPLAKALLHPETGELQQRVRELIGVGRRRYENQQVLFHLEQQGICVEDIAKRIGKNRTTVMRIFSGQTVSKWWDDLLFTQFQKELRGLEPPLSEQKFIAGYCYAITNLRCEVLEMLEDRSERSLMHDEFCLLWHMLSTELWRQATRDGSDELIAKAAHHVAERASANFPCVHLKRRSTPELLLRIHETWGLWFRLVVFCATDEVK